MPAVPRLVVLPGHRQPAPAHGHGWSRRRPRSSGPSSQTEVEALQLEYSWIKEYDPRFNVKYRDDKSYPWLAVTLNEEFPRVMVGRGAKKKGVRYFGPYSHAWAIRETVDLLLRVFPMRSCSAGVFKRSAQIGRPCLLGYIGKCSAPCVGRVTRRGAPRRSSTTSARSSPARPAMHVKRLEREMRAASDQQEYERAARLRDDIGALKRAMEKNAVVLADGTDADVIAVAEDPLEIAVQVFYVRGGRVRGQRGWVADRVDDAELPELLRRFLIQVYDGESSDAIPREVLLPRAARRPRQPIIAWLSDKRGSKVAVRVPAARRQAQPDGDGRRATPASRWRPTRPRRASDLTTRSRALEEIQQALGLDGGAAADRVLRRLQPAGHRGGRLDGRLRGRAAAQERLPAVRDQGRRRAERRRGHARDHHPPVPAAARRARRVRASPTSATPSRRATGPVLIDPETGRPRKFAYAPGPGRRRRRPAAGGGRPTRARRARASTTSRSSVWPSGSRRSGVRARPTRSSCRAPARASTCCSGCATRPTGSRSPTTATAGPRPWSRASSTTCPGLGEVRRKVLLRHFGSLKRLRAATLDEIAALPGFGARTAEAIVARPPRRRRPRDPAVNTATGEILDDGPDDGRSVQRPGRQ